MERKLTGMQVVANIPSRRSFCNRWCVCGCQLHLHNPADKVSSAAKASWVVVMYTMNNHIQRDASL